ncbi:MAG: cardiolipin synthase [Ruminococcus sp.]|jgi:cardiolipin synthase|nr:cardiolipin synthase [Ruminococcus sp.]
MNKFWRVVFSRKIIIFLLLLVQIAVFAAALIFLEAYTGMVYAVMTVIAVVAAIRIISSDDNPAYKLAWIIPVLVIPIFGAAAYLFYKSQVGVRILKENAVSQKFAAAPLLPQSESVINEIDGLSEAFFGLCSYMKDYAGFPVYKNETAEYLSSGEEFYDIFLADIKSAEKFILLEFFIVDDGIMWDSILEVLREKSDSGLEVKIMYDGMGSQMGLPSGYEKKLREYGLECHVFNPVRPLVSTIQNNRDHRKIAVIDGVIAYTGGVNLADEYINKKKLYGHWKDTAVRITGEAVWSFTVMFFELWNIASMEPRTAEIIESNPEILMRQTNHYKAEQKLSEPPESGFVLPFSDSPIDDEHIAESAYIDMISRANKYVYISTPYLVVDSDMLKTLAYAAKRGVDVRILTPKIQDKPYMQILGRSYYKGLLGNGVKIYEYTPGFNHAKILVADDRIAEVGSVNFDFRSLYLHFECAAILFMCPAITRIKQDMLDTFSVSEEINLDKLKTYSLPRRIAGSILKLFAPLL